MSQPSQTWFETHLLTSNLTLETVISAEKTSKNKTFVISEGAKNVK